MKRLTIKLDDESELIVQYTYSPGNSGTYWQPPDPPEWDVTELFHERPLEKDHNGVPLASTLTNLHGLIEAITSGGDKGPLGSLYCALEKAIWEAES